MIQLFEELSGIWELQRHLGEQGHMKGVASFQPCGEGVLHYQEKGKATFKHSQTFSSYREYAYVYNQGTIAVHFWDQKHKQPARLLHTLQFHSSKVDSQELVGTGTHGCADDLYHAHYLFMNPQQFRLTYQVQGPRKDYTLTSHFRKITDTSATA